MTEDDAKTKWCPFVRAAAPVDSQAAGTAGNRWGDSDPTHPASGFLCIGSDCMAWRRRTVLIDRATLEPAQPGVAAMGALEERYSAEGFCGLAGAPA